jgi:hypothetical protein
LIYCLKLLQPTVTGFAYPLRRCRNPRSKLQRKVCTEAR